MTSVVRRAGTLAILMALVNLLFTPVALADVKGRVRIAVGQSAEVWLGEQVAIELDLATTGFSFSDIHFNLPEVAGGILLQPDTTTVKLTETRNGESWQILRYPLLLYPQKSGRITVPPIAVRFSSVAAFGAQPRRFDLRTESLSLRVSQPPGTRPGEPLISTPAFKLSFAWQPEGNEFQVGDALQLRVTQSAQGVSGMFFAPVPAFSAAGISTYSEAPVIKDQVSRGALTGTRTDRMTWVFEQPGRFEFPELAFAWWDPDGEQLKTSLVPVHSVNISAHPLAPSVPPAPGMMMTLRNSLIAVLTLALAVLAWRLVPGAAGFRTLRREDPERQCFRRLLTACRGDEAKQAYEALSHWVALIDAGSTRPNPTQFAQGTGRNDLSREVQRLQQALIDPEAEWRGNELGRIVKSLRRNRTTLSRSVHGYDLPTLNPQDCSSTHG